MANACRQALAGINKEGPLPNAEWGEKHTCQSCGARFYDLKKKPPVCPKCETEVKAEKPTSLRQAAAAAAAEKKATAAAEEAKPKEVAAETDDDDDDAVDDEAAALLEDDSENDTLIADDDDDEDETDVSDVVDTKFDEGIGDKE